MSFSFTLFKTGNFSFRFLNNKISAEEMLHLSIGVFLYSKNEIYGDRLHSKDFLKSSYRSPHTF